MFFLRQLPLLLYFLGFIFFSFIYKRNKINEKFKEKLRRIEKYKNFYLFSFDNKK